MPSDPLDLPPEATPEDRRASVVLAEALRKHQDQIAPVTVDSGLDARILGEARRRSEQLSGNRAPALSGRAPAAGRDVGWLLWLSWAAAIGGAVALWWFLR